MKLGNAVKYRYKKLFKAAAVYFVLLCTVILAGLIASFISKTDRSINLVYVSDIAANFSFYITVILSFFFGICSYKSDFKFLMQNGVSRQSIHLSFIASLLINAITVFINTVIAVIVCLIADTLGAEDVFYPKQFITLTLICCALMCIGYFISAFIYSVKSMHKIITAGVIALLFLLFVLFWHLKCQGSLLVILYAVYGFLFGSLTGFIYFGHLVAALLCLIAFNLSLSHIITLKAVIKK